MATRLTYSSPEDPVLKKLAISSIENLTGRKKLQKKYEAFLNAHPAKKDIWQLMLEILEIRPDYDQQQLQKIDLTSQTIFIANHPFGVVDGILFGHLVSRLTEHFYFLVNAALCKEELLNQFFLPIDFSPTKKAQLINIESKNKALEMLKLRYPIVIFPSGGVATSRGFWKKAEELEWKRFVVKLIKKSEANVVPIFFHGKNSRLFQIASNISMDFRLAFLLNEVRNKIGKSFRIEIGDTIEYEKIKELHLSAQDTLGFLQQKVEQLGNS
jgi:putative hemolysin